MYYLACILFCAGRAKETNSRRHIRVRTSLNYYKCTAQATNELSIGINEMKAPHDDCGSHACVCVYCACVLPIFVSEYLCERERIKSIDIITSPKFCRLFRNRISTHTLIQSSTHTHIHNRHIRSMAQHRHTNTHWENILSHVFVCVRTSVCAQEAFPIQLQRWSRWLSGWSLLYLCRSCA